MNHGLLGATIGLLVLGGGCTPADETPSPAPAGGAGVTAPPPFVMPDLSGLPEAVREQVRQRHDALRRAEESGAAIARGNAYGELGLILMATRFYEAAEIA
ncbi:MAG: hypothetical protein F4Y14_11190 [Acidobacteria bacterium]|nr:hypothetical protein [Acidobacteriota bacterium]